MSKNKIVVAISPIKTQLIVETSEESDVKQLKELMTKAMKGRKMLIKSTIIELILKMIVLVEIFFIKLQKTAKTGPESEAK